MTPEQKAHQQIDAMLEAAGWQVQDKRSLNLHSAPGIALCETIVVVLALLSALPVTRHTRPPSTSQKVLDPQVAPTYRHQITLSHRFVESSGTQRESRAAMSTHEHQKLFFALLLSTSP